MHKLPIVDGNSSHSVRRLVPPGPGGQRGFWVWMPHLTHCLRMAMIGLLVLGLHRQAKVDGAMGPAGSDVWSLKMIAKLVPVGLTLRSVSDDPRLRETVSADGRRHALWMCSSPQADHIIGYSGPTRLLMVMDDDRSIREVKILNSFDTAEHLRKVEDSLAFWRQFVGWRLGQREMLTVDGVSGATLTSLAIAESVIECVMASPDLGDRGGGQDEASLNRIARRSLKFPKEITNEEVLSWIKPAHPIAASNGKFVGPESTQVQSDGRVRVFTGENIPSGWVFRTGPLTDDIIGYQGPSELLMKISDSGVLLDVMLRTSFDNEPYVRYTKQERSFWKRFKNRELSEIATIDLEKEQIDGVSGATMTSVAVAKTIRDAAKAYLVDHADKPVEASSVIGEDARRNTGRSVRWNFSSGELLTAVVALASVYWSFSRYRGNRRARFVWQLMSVLVLVLVSGNLLSIALFSGWTRGGPSYRLAPGITTLLVISFLMASITKRNVYCDHLCPHGILQQWIRPSRPSKSRLGQMILVILHSNVVTASLQALGYAAIASAFIAVVIPLPLNLAWLEPFDAYVLLTAFSFSSVVFFMSLIAARSKPLYYCRVACPTGKIMDYVRRSRHSGSISILDLVVLVAVVITWST